MTFFSNMKNLDVCVQICMCVIVYSPYTHITKGKYKIEERNHKEEGKR